MLNPLQSNGPEQYFFDANAGATYRPLSELSDSDEAEMDISEGEGDAAGSGEPSGKRARLGVQQSALDDSVPKWSNPDPYTALPPPDTAGKPRKDVVQLIRKARVETNESKASIPAEAADFIPCDFDDSDDDGGDDVEVVEARPVDRKDVSGVPGVPTGPRSGPQTVDKAQPAPSRSGDNALGSRKRTHDDVIKLPAHAKLKKVTKMPARGSLVREWFTIAGEDPSPWLGMDHSRSTNMSNW